MARLLVSVRSADEARDALAGGADVIDIKEPTAGPLGCATPAVWREVRAVVPSAIPLSVALGELPDWLNVESTRVPPREAWAGISFAKMGLAGAGLDWVERYAQARSGFGLEDERPSWVAVIYADADDARAPVPDQIIDASLNDPRCGGILVDTWNKASRPGSKVDPHWRDRAHRIRASGRFLAWAGGLGLHEIERLADSELSPDIIAVRGGACRGGDRLATIDAARVAQLKEAAGRVGLVTPR